MAQDELREKLLNLFWDLWLLKEQQNQLYPQIKQTEDEIKRTIELLKDYNRIGRVPLKRGEDE